MVKWMKKFDFFVIVIIVLRERRVVFICEDIEREREVWF